MNNSTLTDVETKVIYLDVIDSTNRYLRAYRDEEHNDLTVAVADYQTAGKGQGTNTWESDPGANLLFSVLAHPHTVPPAKQFLLSEAAALAVKETVDSICGSVTLKWPNDIYWNDKKLGGILIETTVRAGLLCNCIFGIGINVNQSDFHSDAPNPVSLRQILHKEMAKDKLLNLILPKLETNLQQVYDGNTEGIRQRYMASLYRRKGFYPYTDKGGKFMAQTVDVLDSGHLILQDTEGKTRSYAFKEVKFE